MKLYLWSNPYGVAYGSSMVFAVAENIRAARQQAAKGTAWSFNEYEQGNAGVDKIKLGKPTRIVNLPCAEWHQWSE